jgi:Restriction endonuclease
VPNNRPYFPRGLVCLPADRRATLEVVRGDKRWDETWHRLREWTQGQGPSERLAQQILLSEGFTGLDPSHPLGGKDGGADAIAYRDELRWVMAVHFPRGQQTPKKIEEKLLEDFEGVAANEADALAFVTNQELRRAERKALAEAAGGSIEFFHLERLTAILDQPKMYGVREQYLSIPVPDGSLDRDARLDELWRESLARSAGRWRGVGLSAREADTLASDLELGTADPSLLPDADDPVVVWTAPMGSGKSIAAERHHQAGSRPRGN